MVRCPGDAHPAAQLGIACPLYFCPELWYGHGRWYLVPLCRLSSLKGVEYPLQPPLIPFLVSLLRLTRARYSRPAMNTSGSTPRPGALWLLARKASASWSKGVAVS